MLSCDLYQFQHKILRLYENKDTKYKTFWKNHPFDHYGLLEVKKKSRPSLSLSSALWEVSPRNRRPLVSSQFKTDSHTEKTGTSPSMLWTYWFHYQVSYILAIILVMLPPNMYSKLQSVRHGPSRGKQLRHKTFAENKEAIQEFMSQTLPCFKLTSHFTLFHLYSV